VVPLWDPVGKRLVSNLIVLARTYEREAATDVTDSFLLFSIVPALFRSLLLLKDRLAFFVTPCMTQVSSLTFLTVFESLS
jgi:hypothetical protein